MVGAVGLKFLVLNLTKNYLSKLRNKLLSMTSPRTVDLSILWLQFAVN